MAMDTGKILIPTEIQTEIVNLAQNESVIAKLSPTTPRIYNNVDYVWFDETGEAEVVGESEDKSSKDYELHSKAGKLTKVQSTTRVSAELEWADEDNRLMILDQVKDAQAKEIARALDYIVLHGANPMTGASLSGYDALVNDGVQVASVDDAMDDIDAMAEAINETYNITGLAMSRKFANKLRAVRVPSTMARYYDVPLNLEVGSIEGINAATSGTVNGVSLASDSGVLAIMGDFSLIKWAYVRGMWMEVIETGDPDGNGDLKRKNQIAIRTEACISHAVLIPEAFAILKSSEASPTSLKATAAAASAKASK